MIGVVNRSVFRAGREQAIRYGSAFLLGAFALFALQQMDSHFAVCRNSYSLLNPKIQCGTQARDSEWDYEPLRYTILKKSADLKASGRMQEVSVLFRDLDHGPRFEIGQYDKFQPASLTKVPVMIAVLHHADLDPAILDKTLSYSGSLKVNLNVDDSGETIEPNTPYTIRELLRKMIVYSDNYSYELLTKELNSTPPPTNYHTFLDLNVLRMMTAPKADFISIQSYSNLFAVLYNTGYLSKQNSQLALELLSQSTYHDGLVAGTPENTRVAHKFGQRTISPTESQLHDCGIVYHPAATYILCVMTSGPGFAIQSTAIAEISRTVYEGVTGLLQEKDSRSSADAQTSEEETR